MAGKFSHWKIFYYYFMVIVFVMNGIFLDLSTIHDDCLDDPDEGKFEIQSELLYNVNFVSKHS